MTASENEARRLRNHREEMEIALAENLPLAEARRRLSQRRQQQLELAIENFHERERRARLADRGAGRCGTATAACQPSDDAPRHYWWMDL